MLVLNERICEHWNIFVLSMSKVNEEPSLGKEKEVAKTESPTEGGNAAAPVAAAAAAADTTAEPSQQKTARDSSASSDNDNLKRTAEEADLDDENATAKLIKNHGSEEDAAALVSPDTVGTDTYTDNDVLSGRGGGTNIHPGNRNFRDLINLHRRAYLKARKNDKPAISRAIVKTIRASKGRFLKRDEKSGLWFEIGDDAAREKTSQALRQRAPEMRKLLFDTEQEEARVMAEDNLRATQQRFLVNMPGQTMMPQPMMVPQMMGQDLMMHTGGAPVFYNPLLLQQMAANKAVPLPQPGTEAYQQMVSQLMGANLPRYPPTGI